MIQADAGQHGATNSATSKEPRLKFASAGPGHRPTSPLIPRYGWWSGPDWGLPNRKALGYWHGPFSEENVIESATFEHDKGLPGVDWQLIKDVWSRHDLGPYGQVYRVGLTGLFDTKILLGLGR